MSIRVLSFEMNDLDVSYDFIHNIAVDGICSVDFSLRLFWRASEVIRHLDNYDYED